MQKSKITCVLGTHVTCQLLSSMQNHLILLPASNFLVIVVIARNCNVGNLKCFGYLPLKPHTEKRHLQHDIVCVILYYDHALSIIPRQVLHACMVAAKV